MFQKRVDEEIAIYAVKISKGKNGCVLEQPNCHNKSNFDQ
jgi:hypothetical protein